MTGLHVADAERPGLHGPGGLTHEAVVHATHEEMLAAVVPFLREGLEAGDAVAVACGAETAEAMVESVGDPRVTVLAPGFTTLRVPDALAALRDAVRSRDGRRLRAVGGLDNATAGSGWTNWPRLESLLNRELAPYPLWLVCALDSSELPPDVLRTVQQAHPATRTASGPATPNPDYLETSLLMAKLAPGQPDPLQDGPARVVLAGVDGLRMLGMMRDRLRAVLPPSAMDFVTSVSEVVTNALVHGLPPVDVTLWTAEHRAVCTIRDRGAGLQDATVGYSARHLAEDPEALLGLRVVHRLCDRVDHELTPEGFTVRLVGSW